MNIIVMKEFKGIVNHKDLYQQILLLILCVFKPFVSNAIRFSLPPENSRKPSGFLTFSEGRERVH